MPERIQRKRTKGWRMPEGAVYVGRGSKWGNPWVVGKAIILTGKRTGEKINGEDAAKLFRTTLARKMETHPDCLEPIRGKNLACWCPLDQPCHADVLLELANAGGA
ncbi:hypothetical protein ACVWY0_003208 [Arthrobacter sp. UYNi723]